MSSILAPAATAAPSTSDNPGKADGANDSAAPAPSKPRRFPRRAAGLLLPLLLGVAWEAGVVMGWIGAHQLPPPSELFKTFVELLKGGTLVKHVWISSLRVAAGFTLGAALGVLAGAAVSLSNRFGALVDPSIQGLRAIPSLAWVPLLLLWLGIDETPKIFLIAIGAFFPVYVATVGGILNVDRKLVEVGQLFGFSRTTLFLRVLAPASLPSIFTGLRTSLSLSWMFLVAAELIAATKGIGYMLSDGRETGRVDLVLAAIITLALLGKLTDGLLKQLESRTLYWRDTYKVRD